MTKEPPLKQTDADVQACFDCVFLMPDVEKDGTPRYKCDRYRREEMQAENPFDGLSETEVKTGNEDCVNWTAKEVVESTEPFPAESSVTTDTVETSESAVEESTVLSQDDPRYLIFAAERREKRLQEVNAELHSLEAQQSACRRQANDYKKTIVDARRVLDRIIFTDIYGFLAIEEEERKADSLPLLAAAEEMERKRNAWKSEKIDRLDLPEKDREKLSLAGFENAGQVAEWISKDWPEKKPGLGGEKIRDRIREAISKIDGSHEKIAAETAKIRSAVPTDATSEEQPVIAESPRNDAWVDEPAEKYFELTSREWKKIQEYFNTSTMIVGDLFSFQSGISSGEIKIKGFGTAFAEKLEAQFLAFWEKFPQKTAGQTDINPVFSEMFYEGMNWQKFSEAVGVLIDDSDGRYDFASDTLDGMRHWASANNHVTPRMIQAASNICGSVSDEYQPMEWEEK